MARMQPQPTLIVFCLLLVVCTGGCASIPSNASLSATVGGQLHHVRLEREEHIALGRFSLALARSVVRLMEDELSQDEMAIIKAVRRVEVSTYSIKPPLGDENDLSVLGVEDRLSKRGWSRMVRTRESGDHTLVMTRLDQQGEIDGIVVLSADRHELELVQVEGDIGEVMAHAIANDPDSNIGFLGS